MMEERMELERLKILTKELAITEKEFFEEFVSLMKRIDVIERMLGIEKKE